MYVFFCFVFLQLWVTSCSCVPLSRHNNSCSVLLAPFSTHCFSTTFKMFLLKLSKTVGFKWTRKQELSITCAR